MPVVPLKQLMADAVDRGYGVPAINIVNDLTLEAVLAAAQESSSPLIVSIWPRTSSYLSRYFCTSLLMPNIRPKKPGFSAGSTSPRSRASAR
jgi:fructose/tagatose bisphosphate aldolase